MAEGFKLTSKIYLEGPVNLKAVTKNVKDAFNGLDVPVNVTLATNWKQDIQREVKKETIPLTASLDLKKSWQAPIKKKVKEQTFDLNATISLNKSWDKPIRTIIKSQKFELPAELKLTNFAKIEAQLKKKQNIPLSPSILAADLTKAKDKIKKSKATIFVDPKLKAGSVKSVRERLQKAKFPITVDRVRLAPGATKTFNESLKKRKFYAPVHLRLAPGAFKAFQTALAAKPITIPVNITYGGSASSKGTGKAQKDIKELAFGFEKFGKDAALAFKRFAAYTAATSGLFLLSRALKTGFGDAIEFQNQLVRLGQVSNKSVSDLRGINTEITKLATNFGVSAEQLLDSSLILAQAGFSVSQTKDALDTLAKVSLAPTFDGLDNAREGLIAIVSQFKEVKKSKRDVEEAFDAINAVSASFAVESEDIIKAIRITGGVASATGASLKQFISIFTAIRSTTRESAESIATGLRTIITRLQRRQTLNALKQIGVDLTDTEGRFIGVYRAVDELGKRLGSLNPADVQFSQLAEELGGYRQIGKVLPLLQQTTLRQRALAIAQRSSGSLADDQARSQESLARSLQKVKESFNAVIRDITQSSAFRTLLTQILDLTKSFIGLGSQLSKFLPALSAIAGVKIATTAGPLLSGLSAGLGGGLRSRTSAYDGKGLVSAGAAQRRSRNASISGGVTTAGVGLAFVAPLIPSIVEKALGPLADESKKVVAGFTLLTGAMLAFHGSIGGAFLRNTSFAGRGNRLGQSVGTAFGIGRNRTRNRPGSYYGYDSSGNRQQYPRNTMTSLGRSSRVREAALRNLGRAAPGVAGNAANIAGFGAGAYFTYRGASQQTQLDNDLETRTTSGLTRDEYIRRYQQSQGNVGFGGGAGVGGFLAPGVGVGVASLTGNPILGVLAALLTPVVTGLAGQFLNLSNAVSEATQQYNRVKFDEKATEFNNFIESVLAGDTSARGRTGDIRSKVDSVTTRRFQEQNEQDRLTLKRDIDNTVGQLSAFNDALIKSTDSLAEYQAEGGDEVLRAIANLDFQTSFDELFASVQESFGAQDNAKEAQRNQTLLNNAILEETIYIRNLNSAITDAALKANQLGASFDNLVGIFGDSPSRTNFTGRPGFGSIADIKTLSNLPQFQRAGEQTVGLLGGDRGPSIAILRELTATAKLTRDLPNLLVEYANAAQGTNTDLEQPAGYILSRLQDQNLPDSVRRAVIAGLENVVSSDTGDTPGIIEDIRSNPNRLSEKILGETGLDELASIISGSSNKIAEEINNLNSKLVSITQEEIKVRDTIVDRLRTQLSRQLNLRELRKQDDLPGTLAAIEGGRVQQQRQFVSPELINRPDRILARLADNFGEQRQLQSRLQDATERPVIEKLNNGLSNLQYEADGLKKAFDVLIDSTDKTTAVQRELQKAQLASNQVFDAVKNVAFGDRDTILGTERGALGALAIGQTRDVRSLPGQLRPDALRFLESFSEVRTAAFGPSKEAGQQFASGREVIQDTVSNYLQGAFGLDKQSADEAAQKVATNRETQLIDKLNALFTAEQANRMNYERLIAEVPILFKNEALAIFKRFSDEISGNFNKSLQEREKFRLRGLNNREGDILGQRKEYESLRRVSADIGDKPSGLEGLRFATRLRELKATKAGAKKLKGLTTSRISELVTSGAGRSSFAGGDAASESLGLGVNKVLNDIIASNPDIKGKFINPSQLRNKIDTDIAVLRAKRQAEADAANTANNPDDRRGLREILKNPTGNIKAEPITATDVAGIIKNVFSERAKEELDFQSSELVTLRAELKRLPEPIRNIVDAISRLPADQFDSIRRGIEGLSASLPELDRQLRNIRTEKTAIIDRTRPASNQGGPVAASQYRGGGNTNRMFRPRGTDTVPAMLTKGEYIVNAKSTGMYRDELEKINQGTFYAAEGGIANKSSAAYFNRFKPYQQPGVARTDLYEYGLDAQSQRQLDLSQRAAALRKQFPNDAEFAKEYEKEVLASQTRKYNDLDARLAAIKTQQADTSAYASVAGAAAQGAGGSLPARGLLGLISGIKGSIDYAGNLGGVEDYSGKAYNVLAGYKDIGVGTLYDLAGLALGDDVRQLGREKQAAGRQALLSGGFNNDLSVRAADKTAGLTGRFFQENESWTNIAAQLSGANKENKYDAAYQFGAGLNRFAEDFVTQAPIDALTGKLLGFAGKGLAKYIPDYNFGSPLSYVGGKIGDTVEAGFKKFVNRPIESIASRLPTRSPKIVQQAPSQVPFARYNTGKQTITNAGIQEELGQLPFRQSAKLTPQQAQDIARELNPTGSARNISVPRTLPTRDILPPVQRVPSARNPIVDGIDDESVSSILRAGDRAEEEYNRLFITTIGEQRELHNSVSGLGTFDTSNTPYNLLLKKYKNKAEYSRYTKKRGIQSGVIDAPENVDGVKSAILLRNPKYKKVLDSELIRQGAYSGPARLRLAELQRELRQSYQTENVEKILRSRMRVEQFTRTGAGREPLLGAKFEEQTQLFRNEIRKQLDNIRTRNLPTRERLAERRAQYKNQSTPIYPFSSLLQSGQLSLSESTGFGGFFRSTGRGRGYIGLKTTPEMAPRSQRSAAIRTLRHEQGHAGGDKGSTRLGLVEFRKMKAEALKSQNKELFIEGHIGEEAFLREINNQSRIYTPSEGKIIEKNTGANPGTYLYNEYRKSAITAYKHLIDRRNRKALLNLINPQEFHTGGKVTGKSGRDNVDIRAEHGEYMLTRQATNSIGEDNLRYMNATGKLPEPERRGYFTGGRIERQIDELVAKRRAQRNVGKVKKFFSDTQLIPRASNAISGFLGTPSESDFNELINKPTQRQPKVQTQRDIARRTEQQRRQGLLTQQSQGRGYRSPLSPYRPGGSVLSEQERRDAVTNRARQSPKVYRSPNSPYNLQGQGSDGSKSGPLNSNKPVQGNSQTNNQQQQQQNIAGGSNAMNSLAAAMATFDTSATKLAAALTSFKGEITIGGQMESMQVIVGGNVSVDAAIMDNINKAVKIAIDNKINTSFPGVGAIAAAKAPMGQSSRGVV